jgi:hypothetical protein
LASGCAAAPRATCRILIVVDQIEELYTLGAPPNERAAFLAVLAAMAGDATSPLRVILAMRSDYLDRLAEHRHLGAESSTQSGGPRRFQRHIEDPMRPLRVPQLGPHPHQHRMHEPAMIEAQPAGRVLPSHVIGESLHRLPIRQPLQLLQHHHHSQNPRRHRFPPDVLEQVHEHLVGKQPMTMRVQVSIDRRRPQRLLAVPRRRVE